MLLLKDGNSFITLWLDLEKSPAPATPPNKHRRRRFDNFYVDFSSKLHPPISSALQYFSGDYVLYTIPLINCRPKIWTHCLRRILRRIGGASQYERYLFATFFTVQLTAAAAGVCETRFCWCRRWMGTPRPLPGWLVSPLKFMPEKNGFMQRPK